MSETFRARRHRITVQDRVYGRDALGGVTVSWRDVCTTWAEIRADVITIRYQPQLLPGMRILAGGICFEIIGVIDRVGKTRLVELRVKELPGVGGFARRALTVNSWA